MQEDEIEYRATLTFQSLKSYLVDEVIAQITEHMHPCNNIDKKFISGCYDTSRKINFRNWREITHQSINNICGQCYDERNAREAYLAKRIYRAVLNERFDLWDSKLDMAEEIPTHQTLKEPTLEQIKYWVKHAYISKADLIKFCGSERIRVVFNGEQTASKNVITEQGNSTNSKEYIASIVSNQSVQGLIVNSQDALSAHVEQATLGAITEEVSVKPLTLAVKLDSPTSTISTNTKSSDPPPGKLPNVAIGKLAIKAAWEIECETGRHATADEVIKRLQAWATKGEDGYLHSKIKFGVMWIPKRSNIAKEYKIEACGKTLEKWLESRH